MFGLTDSEMEEYREITLNYAVMELAPKIVAKSLFMVPYVQDSNEETDVNYARMLLNDIETIISLVCTYVAHDYANYQSELDLTESEIIKILHDRYENALFFQFMKYGIAVSTDVITDIIGDIILELPYLYLGAIEDDSFDEEEFLEERLQAYNDYLDENFSDNHNVDDEEEWDDE